MCRIYFFNASYLEFLYSCHINFVFPIIDPPMLTTKPVNQTVREDSVVEFHCSATGNPVPKITWIKDGRAMKNGDALSFTVNRNQSGQYWCSADNGFSTVANASAHLDVLCKYQGYVSFSITNPLPYLYYLMVIIEFNDIIYISVEIYVQFHQA